MTRTGFTVPVLLFVFCLIAAPAAAAGIQAAMGETVPLSGFSPSNPDVYLFLTGPNLPANGVALNDITKRADQGGFTVVAVRGEDNRWSYNWHTGSVNGRLDAGTYTVWAVNGPFDRSHLQNAEYGTISVTLGTPSLSITTQTIPGTLSITSVPDNASVTVNGEYRGMTPLRLGNLDPGQYIVSVTKFGYSPSVATTILRSGEVQDVAVTLMPGTGSVLVNTTPAGARVSIDGRETGVSPITLTDIPAGNHTIVLALDGYTSFTEGIEVVPGRTAPLAVALVPVATPAPSFPVKTPGMVPAVFGALFTAAAVAVAFRNRP